MADVFISYSRRDTAFTQRLGEGLEGRGKHVWVDLNDIMPSAPWMAEIRVAIAEADTVVFVVSPASVASQVCQAELQHAVDLNKRLVPVVALPTPIADVPGALAALNFLDFSADSSDEAFATDLARLVDVLDTDLDAVHQHTRLLLRTTEWEESHEDAARLLRGRHLGEAESWLSTQSNRNPAPTSGQVRLILASRRAAVRRQRRSTLVALAVAMGMIGLSLFAVLQWHTAVVQRGEADSRADAAEADNQLQADPPLALKLALQSFRAAGTDQAQTALRAAVQASLLRAIVGPMKQAELALTRTGTGGLGQVAVDPSGAYVAVSDTVGGVEVWRWHAQRGPGSFSDPYRLLAGARQAEFVDGGRQLLVASQSGSILEWDWETARTAVVLRRGLQNVVLSQNGALAANFSNVAGTVAVTMAASGRPVSSIATGPVAGAAFSPDGTYLATWGAQGSGPVKLWDARDGHLVESVGASPVQLGGTGEVPVAIRPGDGSIAVAGSNEISVYSLVDPTQAPQVLDMTAPPGASSDGGGTFDAGSLTWSANGEALAEGGFDEALRVWSGDLDGQIFIGPAGNGAGGVVFSPDGEYLVSADNLGQARVWAWEADDQDSLSVPIDVPAPLGVPAAATISPSGTMVAYVALQLVDPSQPTHYAGAKDAVDLWDWHNFTGYNLTAVAGPSFSGLGKLYGQPVQLAFSPNGRWLAVSSSTSLSVWDVVKRRRLASLPLSQREPEVTDITFDSSGRALAAIETALSNGDAPKPASLLYWRWGSSAAPGLLAGLKLNSVGDLGIDQVSAGGSVSFVYGHDYMSWAGTSSRQPTVIGKNVVPTGDLLDAAFFDGGKEMVFGVGSLVFIKTEVVDLATGTTRPVLGGYEMQGTYVNSPDGRVVAGTAGNGDVVVWDESTADLPQTIPTTSSGSYVSLAANVLLIAEPSALFVVPDSYCEPIDELVPLAQSLLVQPTGWADATTYND